MSRSGPRDVNAVLGSRYWLTEKGWAATDTPEGACSSSPSCKHIHALEVPERTGPVPLKDCIDEVWAQLIEQRDNKREG